MTSQTRFLADREAITAEIHRLIGAQPAHAPILMIVAFWGRGAESLVVPDKRFRLMCNLSSGVTNPDVIRALMRRDDVEFRQRRDLHAKVVLTESGALVSSANLSSFGLALHPDGEGWLEAGVALPASSAAYLDVSRWVREIWGSAGAVTEELLREEARRFQASAQGEAACEPEGEGSDSEPDEQPADFGLTFNLVFGPPNKGNPNNPLRAASDLLDNLYRRCLDRKLTTRDAYVPRYIAHLLWTHIGNPLDWRDGTFQQPAEVASAWRRPGVRVKDEVVYEFLTWLAAAEQAPEAIRTASRDLLGNGWGEALRDATDGR